MAFRHFLALGLALALSACGAGQHPPPGGAGGTAAPAVRSAAGVVAEEYMVDAKDEGVRLYLRNKRPADYYNYQPEKTVLFVHGASYPGHASFDLQLSGQSWMDWLAARGYDVYSVDIRGFGKSTRPTEMGKPAAEGKPVVDTATAMSDLGKAMDFILSRRGLPRLTLVGWSWGATVAGSYAAQASNRVERLVLLAPQWLHDTPAPAEMAANLGAWRKVPLEKARDHWLAGVPERERAEFFPQGWYEAWAEAMRASDAEGAAQTPPVMRAPNGPLADTLKTWASGTPQWQPERLSVPTMVVQGEWDLDSPPAMGLGIYARLDRAPARRYVLLGKSTHSVMMEKNRLHLFRAVQGFLEEKF